MQLDFMLSNNPTNNKNVGYFYSYFKLENYSQELSTCYVNDVDACPKLQINTKSKCG